MKKIVYSFLSSMLLLANGATAQSISSIAGNGSISFSGDGGTATAAQLGYPYGIVADGSGNLFFCDLDNNRVRKISSSKVVSTFAGTGAYSYTGDGGAATAATLNFSPDVAIDGSGNIYIADQANNVIRKVSATGTISTVAGTGTAGFSGDGSAATAAKMSSPSGVAVDGSGNLFIADQKNNRIRKVNTSGIISTIAGTLTSGFSGDGGPATAAQIDNPYGVAVDGSGNVYFADFNNNVIRKINSSGIIRTYAGTGGYDYTGDGGPATAADLYYPTMLKTDASGNLYFSDYGNYAIRKVSTGGTMSTVAGNGYPGFAGDGGSATSAELYLAMSMCVDGSGNLYITDAGNNRIRKVSTSGTISTYAGGGMGNGAAATAVSYAPYGTVIDGSGNLYIADANNSRICKINTSGGNSTLAGNGTYGYTGDGGAATASQLSFPVAVAMDGSGNIYVADQYNSVVRKISTTGNITTIAGDGTLGYGGDGGAATAGILNYPSGVAVDGAGNVYIADAYNDRIRKVNTSGIISTYAGDGSIGYSGDGGQATDAKLDLPTGIALDASGNLFITEEGNNVVRKVSSSSVITTIAGAGTAGYSGDGGPATAAEFYSPRGVAVDASGNLFISDAGNSVVRKINVLGIVSTMAGDNISGFLGDGGPATAAELTAPAGITIDASGKVYVADYYNYRIRKVNSASLPPITGSMVICAGATSPLTNATTGGTWTSTTTAVATVLPGTGVVTGVAAGTSTIIYAVAGNTIITTVTVNPLPVPGTVTGLSSVCAGFTIALSDAAPGGVWSTSNSSTSVSGGTVTGLVAGTSTISYAVTNSCGTLYALKTVTINPLPSIAPITGGSTVCQSLTLALTDITTGGTWSSSNANASVSAGVVTGVSGGTATISYVVTNVCGAATALKAITVNPSPAAGTITGPAAVCLGLNITLTDAIAGGAWSSSNSNISVAGGVVTGVALGTATVSYAVTNVCGTATTTKTITVNPMPFAGAITGGSAVCVGSAIALSNATSGGVWTSSSLNAGVSGGVVSGLTAGTATISYTFTNVCGSAVTTKSVTINPTVTAGTITGATSVCVGASTTLTDAVAGGVWSSTNTNVSVSAGVVTGVVAGTSVVRYTVTTACGTATALKTVTISPLPVVAAITGGINVCAGGTLTLSDVTAGGVWSSSNTSATVSGGIVSGVTAGSDTINYSVTNACGTTTAAKPITVVPSVVTAGTITGSSSVCVGATTVLINATGGGVWSSSNTNVSVSGGVVTGVATGTSTISYVVTASCGSATTTATITINPAISAGTITGLSSVCAGNTIALTDATGGGVWSNSNTNASVVAGVVTGVSTGTSIISYAVTVACGTATAIKTITINPLPSVASITGFSNVCAGSSITLTDATPGGVWSSSNTTAATVSGGVVTGVSGGTTIISYVFTNSCGSATATQTVTIDPLASAGTITGLAAVCPGATVTLTNASAGGAWSSSNTNATVAGGVVTGVVSGTTTISYVVTNICNTATSTKTITVSALPTVSSITGLSSVCTGANIKLTDATSGGVWSSSNTNAIVTTGTVVGVFAGVDTISYSVTNSCGTATATKTVNILPYPNVPAITGVTAVCVGSTTQLTDALAGGTWSISNTSASVSGGLVSGLIAGNVTIGYSISNSCGTTTVTTSVVVNPLPAAITGAASICLGATSALSNASGGGDWTSTSSIISVGSASGDVTGLSTGTALVTYTLTTGCSISKTVTVLPLPVVYAVFGGGKFCAGDTGVHVGLSSSDTRIKYQLYNGGVATGGLVRGTGLSLDFGLQTTGGIYTVEAVDTVTSCTNTMSSSAKVIVNPLPLTITGLSSVCAGSAITLSDATTGGKWSSGSSLAGVGTSSGIVTGLAAGTVSIYYTLPTGCYTSSLITVNPSPAPIAGPTSSCTGLAVTLVDAGGGTWSSSNTLVATIVPGSGVTTAVAPGTTMITYRFSTGCNTSSSFTVNPLPLAITGNSSVCSGLSTSLVDPSGGGSWSSSDASVATVDAGTGSVTGVAAGSVIITYMLPTGCIATFGETVNPQPDAGTIAGSSTVCIDSSITLTDAIAGGAWSSNNALATVSASGVVSGVTAGTATISYEVTNMCGTAVALLPLTIVNCKLSVVVITDRSAALKVYPNPNEGMFMVNMVSDINEPVTIVITNMIGEKIREVSWLTNTPTGMQLNVAAGMYLVSATTAHGTYVAKVTID